MPILRSSETQEETEPKEKKGAEPLREARLADSDRGEIEADEVEDASGDQHPPVRAHNPVCSLALRELVLDAYPALQASVVLRRFFAHVVYATVLCPNTGWVPVPYGVLARIAGQSREAKNKSFSGKLFLEDARDRAFPGLQWANADKDRGLARRIRTLGLRTDVQAAIEREMACPLGEIETPVWFISGETRTPKKARGARTRTEKAIAYETSRHLQIDEEDGVLPYPADSYGVLQHMNRLSSRLFTSAVQAHISEALELATLIPDARKRSSALAVLNAVQDAPRPLYQLSDLRRSVRIFPASASLLTLPAPLRRVLTADWPEFDLRSSQLAIAARQWGDKEVCDMLSDGYDVWDDISKAFGLEVGSTEWEEVKPAFKQALYSALFGMSTRGVKGKLTRKLQGTNLSNLGPNAANRFVAFPVIESMLEHRDLVLAGIEENGGARDCYDRFIPVRDGSSRGPEVSPRSVLAQLAQAMELAIVYPALEVVRKQRDLHLTLWQHDGFSLAMSDPTKAERHARQVTAAVDAQAAQFGVPTCLVQKMAPAQT
ncbi:hypothetical protein [Rubrivirga sp.]|uniref:hypothetical protein n=1 Tax=Rubrivirga sp. TaxID=1885344 RepID=UPI003C71C486